MKSIKEYLIREGYSYNKNDFSPKDCLEWLIKNHKIEMYDGKIGDEDELDEYAQQAQYAAEDEGVPTEDAERVYDYCFVKFGND